MNFPKFWARGHSGAFSAWRWSDLSVNDASSEAQAAAQKMAAQFASGERINKYGYGNRPMREPVLRELRNGDGEVHCDGRVEWGLLPLSVKAETKPSRRRNPSSFFAI